jgi:hypothetical protein
VIDSPELVIARLASRQQHCITWRQLLDAGLTPDGIGRRVRSFRLFPAGSAVYCVGHPAATMLEKASAAVLACGPAAALSHASALTLFGLWRRWEEPLEVTIRAGDRRPKGIRVRRSRTLRPFDTTLHNGIRVTRLARAVLDTAPRLRDEQLHRTIDNALHTTWMTRGQLVEQLVHNPLHRGTRRIREYLSTGDGPTRSDWERAFPAFCKRYGLPRPRLIQRLGGNEVDALFEAERLVVELDSWRSHSSRAAFERDRDRDADNLALGHSSLRITWQRLIGRPDREAARLQVILEQCRRRAA